MAKLTEQDAWEQEKRKVTLTNREWNLLATYILMTTDYRWRNQYSWVRLSTEEDEDGKPAFSYAADNAEFWKQTDATLERIKRKIDDTLTGKVW